MNFESLRKKDTSWLLRSVICAFTLAFYVGAILAPDLPEIFSGFWRIQTQPSVLTKDYFFLELGSVSGSMLNYGIVATVLCALTFLPGATVTGTTVAAYFLTMGFCSYGMNVINVLPFFLGVFVYSKLKREPFAKFINFAMFCTALSPLVSEVLFRYPGTEVHGITPLGVGLALLIGIVVGCVMPVLCAHSPNFHKGYDLYNAGPAAGFLCFMLFAIMYKTLGIPAPEIKATLGAGSRMFVNVFCCVCFGLCVLYGFILNGGFKGYEKVIADSGFKVDFSAKYGAGLCIMNLGIYGLFIVAYYNLVGATFTGATFGAIWCMLSFGAAGSTPWNVLPIMIGYVIASQFGAFPINNQAIVVGLCFASGLAPVSGRYGIIAGIVAGILHYCIVTSVPAIHGGFNLYNGGFTAGLVCFVLVPVLEAYFKTKDERRAAKIK